MFKRSHFPQSLFVIGIAVVMLAGCATAPFHLITPVAPQDSVAEESAVSAVEEGTPKAPAAEETAATEADEAAVAEVEEENAEEADEEVEQIAEEVAAGMESGMMPVAISHKLARREECRDCHAPDGRESIPADHIRFETNEYCLFCHMPEEGNDDVPAMPDPMTDELCLTCHGPFHDLEERTAAFLDSYGEVANPHVMLPHDGTNPIACDNCHETHTLPLVSMETVTEANYEYCYAACHHERTWNPCSECHED